MTSDIEMLETAEPKRIKKFRFEVAKIIPKFPNDKATLQVLLDKPLGSLLINYLNWARRLISIRPRKIVIEPTLTADPRWKKLSADTKIIIGKAERGENLNAHLSLKVLRNGFTPATSIVSPDTDKWADKDFLINTMGYHHLHLSQILEPGGHFKRTDDVLLAQITKSTFHAIGFFDHSVFDSADPVNLTMSAERERLWKIHDERRSFGREPGAVYIDMPIATSGHSVNHVRLAGDFARIIYAIDPKLDTLSTRSEIFPDLTHEALKAMKLSWKVIFMNLGLFDKTTSSFHVLKYGEY
jgi:hypothetical protein